MSNYDINLLLKRWYETKNEITELEKKLKNYKRIADNIMKKQEKNTISSNKFILKKRNMSRQTINKRNIPKTIWDKYCKTSNYNSYYLSKK